MRRHRTFPRTLLRRPRIPVALSHRPGYLLQADVLSVLAPVLSARSDTSAPTASCTTPSPASSRPEPSATPSCNVSPTTSTRPRQPPRALPTPPSAAATKSSASAGSPLPTFDPRHAFFRSAFRPRPRLKLYSKCFNRRLPIHLLTTVPAIPASGPDDRLHRRGRARTVDLRPARRPYRIRRWPPAASSLELTRHAGMQPRRAIASDRLEIVGPGDHSQPIETLFRIFGIPY